MMNTERLRSIDVSATANLLELASELIQKGEKIIQLSVGEPDFNTPDRIIEAAYAAMRDGKTHYTPPAGIPELRKKIAEKMNSKYDSDISMKNVLITPTKFGIFLSLSAIAEKGNSVLIPDPGWVSYKEIVRFNLAKDIRYNIGEDGRIDEEEIKEKIVKGTSAIIINSPSNPMGTILTKDELKFFRDMAEDNNILVISDEVYGEIYFESRPLSILEVADSLENIIVVNGFSKSHAMTGWRVGFTISSEKNIKSMNKIQQHTITCTPSISQYAALKAVDCDEEVENMRKIYRKRRDKGLSILSEFMDIKKPAGTFYFFPKYRSNKTSKMIAEELLKKKGVLVVPGCVFGENGEYHLRISFAVKEEKLVEGLEKIREFFSTL